MGLLFKIQLKKIEDADVIPFNKKLEEMGIKGSFTTYQDNLDWVNYINEKDSKEAYMRPENGKMTVELLKKAYSLWTKEGMFDTDIGFSRTPVTQMTKIVRFVVENKDAIEFIDNGDSLIERSGVKNKTRIAILGRLEQVDEEPEKLSKDEQTNHSDTQSGQLLCKSFSIKPFWVVFGNVEEPTFMKTRIYVDNLYNDIYKDKKGLSYMLIPLVTLDTNPKFGKLSRDEFFKRAWEMGLREHPNFFFPFVYNDNFVDGVDLEDLAKDFADHYTADELQERFDILKKEMDDKQRCTGFGYGYNDKQKKYLATNSSGKLDLLSICKLSLEIKENAAQYKV